MVPLAAFYEQLREAFRASRRLVIAAPTGAGKSAFLPLWAARDWLPEWGETGRVLVAEPRRVAARSLARYAAGRWPTRVGDEVGYVVRFDHRADEGTRLTYVTDGILLRLLEEDPVLKGVGLVFLDEFHERRVDADVALGLLLQAAQRRPELRIVILSATLEGQRVAEFIGGAFLDLGASQIQETPDGERVFNGLHPVEIRYLPVGRSLPEVIQAVPDVVRRALAETDGDVLVFLPGKPEIEEVRRLLGEIRGVVIHSLHGEMDDHAQDAALAPDPQGRRKVDLSTNIAEASLTIEGVTAVVDTGYEKISRFRPPAVYSLEPERISRASATQRAGRAGRTGPGVVYRLWSREEHHQLPASRDPEILREDPMDVVLRLAARGIRIEELPLLDRPDPERVQAARSSLADLGLLDPEGQVTRLGRAAAKLPLSARLARMVLEALRQGAGLELVLRTAAAASVSSLLVRLQDPQQEEAARRARRPLEEEAARMGSDLFLGALALDRPVRELKDMGFRISAVEEARDILGQLRAQLRGARGELRPLGVDLPELSGRPRDADMDPAAARRAIAAGLADRLAFRYRRDEFKVLAAPEPFYARLGRESLLGQADLIAPWEPREVQGRRGSFRILTGCTRVDPEAWLEIAPPRARQVERRAEWDVYYRRVRVILYLRDPEGTLIFSREAAPLPEEIEEIFSRGVTYAPDTWVYQVHRLLDQARAWDLRAAVAQEVGRLARQVGATRWEELRPHLPSPEEIVRKVAEAAGVSLTELLPEGGQG
jgi:HrpA-like RNA helicase